MQSKILIDWDKVPNERFKTVEDLYVETDRIMQLFFGSSRISRYGEPGRTRPYTIIIERSPGGSGFHGIVTIPGKRIAAHRILLAQLLCGSDPKREFLNFERIQKGVKDWNILFETKLEEL